MSALGQTSASTDKVLLEKDMMLMGQEREKNVGICHEKE